MTTLTPQLINTTEITPQVTKIFQKACNSNKCEVDEESKHKLIIQVPGNNENNQFNTNSIKMNNEIESLLTKEVAMPERKSDEVSSENDKESDSYDHRCLTKLEGKKCIRKTEQIEQKKIKLRRKYLINSNAKKHREMVEKICGSYKDLMKKREEKHNQVLDMVQKNNEEKITQLTEFFSVMQRNLLQVDEKRQKRTDELYKQIEELERKLSVVKFEAEKDLQNVVDELNTENKDLKELLRTYEHKIESIQNLISDVPVTVLPSRPIENQALQKVTNENENLKKEIEKLNQELRDKSAAIAKYECKVKYMGDIFKECTKQKTDFEEENKNLKTQIDAINIRHKHQFDEYEKIINNFQQKEKISTKEINKLMQHIQFERQRNSPAPINITVSGKIQSSRNFDKEASGTPKRGDYEKNEKLVESDLISLSSGDIGVTRGRGRPRRKRGGKQ